MVTTQTLTQRRLGAGPQLGIRRRRSRPGLAQAAGEAVAARLRLSALGRVYLGAAVVLVCLVCYLMLAAQATQASYDITRLRSQQADLLAQQEQLRYQEAALGSPARLQQEALQAGLVRSTPVQIVPFQPVAVNLDAHDAVAEDATPLWQRAVASLLGGLGARDALAAGR